MFLLWGSCLRHSGVFMVEAADDSTPWLASRMMLGPSVSQEKATSSPVIKRSGDLPGQEMAS